MNLGVMGIMAMNEYFPYPMSPELGLPHQMQFSVIPWTSFFWEEES